MKKDRIDTLLQLAYLEGLIRTHGAYEKSVARKTPSTVASRSARESLQQRLEAALGTRSSSAAQPLTVGEFLKQVRHEQSLRSQDLFSRLGLTQNIYRMLEQDRISPLKIHPEVWAAFRRFFQISTDSLVEMIRRTHQLVFFRPAFRTTLARYDSRKQKGMKATTLERAATELYTKAKLKLPPVEGSKIRALIDSISGSA